MSRFPRRWSGLIGVLRTPTVDRRRFDQMHLLRPYPLPLVWDPYGRTPNVVGQINTVATAGRLVLAWGDTLMDPGSYTAGASLADVVEQYLMGDRLVDRDQVAWQDGTAEPLLVLTGTLIGATVHDVMDRPGRLDLWPGQPTEIEVEP